LALVRSLSMHPKLLLMDEPFDGIDIENRAKTIRVIHACREKYGMTMMLTSHVMADIEDLASRIIIIKKGRLLVDEPLDRFGLREGKDMACRYLRVVEDE